MAKKVILWYCAFMNLGKILKKHVESNRIFYVTLDPERALGLEDILPNYTIICPYRSRLTDQLKASEISIFILEENISKSELSEIIKRGTYGILQFLAKNRRIAKNDNIIILKTSSLIEDLCKRKGWKLLAPKARISEQFENKISQYKALRNIVPYPNSTVRSLELLLQNVTQTLNQEAVVLQFNRGHSGNSTFFINSKTDLKKFAKKFPKREAKISEYIRGKTYTLNSLILSTGQVISGSLSKQITGLKRATNNPNTTCGNDFTSAKKLSKVQVKKVQEIAQITGAALYGKGYRGLFGIDVIIQNKIGKVYFIEVNTHQPASISFEAKLHRKIGRNPLLAYFILDNFQKTMKIDKRIIPSIVLPIPARQIIYRNKTSKVLTQRYIEKTYKTKGLLSRMRLIRPNEEIYRKQYGI